MIRLKRIFYICISPLRKLYWFVFRPHTRGAKMLIEYNGQLLLVRNTYGKKLWTFPGGGVNKNESFYAAAIREAREEVGIHIKKADYIGTYTNTLQYKIDTVECFYTKVSSPDFAIDPGEILEARWVKPDQIPKPATARMTLILPMRENYIKLHHQPKDNTIFLNCSPRSL